MRDLFFPSIFAIAAVIAAVIAYRDIRRGGARYYTLEREAMLRRASFTMVGAVVLFLLALASLMYQQVQNQTAADIDAGILSPLATATATLSIFPPTITPTPTLDASIPTATATPIIRRAIVDGTSGNGLTLRDQPGGNEVAILQDGTVVTLLDDEPRDFNGFTWLKVRTFAGAEGWVAQDFLIIRDQ